MHFYEPQIIWSGDMIIWKLLCISISCSSNSIKITNYRTNEITDNWGCAGICDSGICHWFTLLLQVSFNQKNHLIDLGSWTCRHLIFSLEYETSSSTRPHPLAVLNNSFYHMYYLEFVQRSWEYQPKIDIWGFFICSHMCDLSFEIEALS